MSFAKSDRPTHREAREASGLPIAQAARTLGVSVKHMLALESGRAKAAPALRVMMLALYDVWGFAEDAGGGRVIHVGFTGTQIGCADAQIAALTRTLVTLGCEVLHHGACVGADAQAHYIARVMKARVELHPPAITVKMARCPMLPGEWIHASAPYLVRNRVIVDTTSVLVACPREETGEELRSGTWATVRYARKIGRPVYIVRPSGRVEEERAHV